MGAQSFHAVQCFSCSTFQVQQVKKVPKFVCASCGAKQSVRTVYGTSNMATHIRLLVQNLNTARGAAEIAQGQAYEECTEQDDLDLRDTNRQASERKEKPARAIAWNEFAQPEDPETHRQLLGSSTDVPEDQYVLVLPERPQKRQKQAGAQKHTSKQLVKGFAEDVTGPSHCAVVGRGNRGACNPPQQLFRGTPSTSARDAAPAPANTLPRPNAFQPKLHVCPQPSGIVQHLSRRTASGHAVQSPSPQALEPGQSHWMQPAPAAVTTTGGQVKSGLHETVRRKAGLAFDNRQTAVMGRHECHVAQGVSVETGSARVSSSEALPAAPGFGASMTNPSGFVAQPIAAASWSRQERNSSLAPHKEGRATSTAPAGAGAVQGSRWSVLAPPGASFTADDCGSAELDKWQGRAHKSGNGGRHDPEESTKARDVQELAWAGKK